MFHLLLVFGLSEIVVFQRHLENKHFRRLSDSKLIKLTDYHVILSLTHLQFVFFYLPNQYNDEATLLRPEDRVRQPGKEVYVAEVQHDVTIPGTKIFIV